MEAQCRRQLIISWTSRRRLPTDRHLATMIAHNRWCVRVCVGVHVCVSEGRKRERDGLLSLFFIQTQAHGQVNRKGSISPHGNINETVRNDIIILTLTYKSYKLGLSRCTRRQQKNKRRKHTIRPNCRLLVNVACYVWKQSCFAEAHYCTNVDPLSLKEFEKNSKWEKQNKNEQQLTR